MRVTAASQHVFEFQFHSRFTPGDVPVYWLLVRLLLRGPIFVDHNGIVDRVPFLDLLACLGFGLRYGNALLVLLGFDLVTLAGDLNIVIGHPDHEARLCAPLAGHAGDTPHPARPTPDFNGMKRFRQFVRTIFPRKKNGNIDENAVYLIPFLAINPMAKDHVTALLDAYLAMDADGIGARVTAAVAVWMADVPGDSKVGLVVADDLMGAGTNRYNDEFAFRWCRQSPRNYPGLERRRTNNHSQNHEMYTYISSETIYLYRRIWARKPLT
jgi:hypothetical protein